MPLLLRIGSVAGLICGALIAGAGLVEVGTGETAATSFLLALSPALAPLLLTALHLGQQAAAGRFGVLAYAIGLAGLTLFGAAAFMLNTVLFGLTDDELTELLAGPPRAALLLAVGVFVAGTVLFAAAMLRAGVYPPAPAWAFGVLLPAFAVAARLPDGPATSALHVLVGGTLAWLAVAVGRLAVVSQGAPRPV